MTCRFHGNLTWISQMIALKIKISNQLKFSWNTSGKFMNTNFHVQFISDAINEITVLQSFHKLLSVLFNTGNNLDIKWFNTSGMTEISIN